MIKAIRELLDLTAISAGAMQGCSAHLPPKHRENMRDTSRRLREAGVAAVLADFEYTDAIRKLLEACRAVGEYEDLKNHTDCDCYNCRLESAAKAVAEFT